MKFITKNNPYTHKNAEFASKTRFSYPLNPKNRGYRGSDNVKKMTKIC